jgi:hypothetical protein
MDFLEPLSQQDCGSNFTNGLRKSREGILAFWPDRAGVLNDLA